MLFGFLRTLPNYEIVSTFHPNLTVKVVASDWLQTDIRENLSILDTQTVEDLLLFQG